MSASAIYVEGLQVAYRQKSGSHLAVKGITFSVQPGEIVGFLGPNGAGKSSTLKVLMGFVEPIAGRAEIFGLQAGSVEARALTGYLPEVAMYYPYLNPRETLRLYGKLQGLGGKSLESEISDLLERLNIAHAAKKLNRSLSKGMLQRVGIAQSLLGNPKLLILDEVTSGLDPVGRRELRDLLQEKRREGTTLFFSSHELAEVDMLCDRVLLLHKGEMIDERPVARLKEELEEFSLVHDGRVALIGSTICDQAVVNGRYCEFESKKDLLMAVDQIVNGGGHILDLSARPGSLEEYFVEKVAA